MKLEDKLKNVITDSLREMERCPNDCPIDIVNEQLKSWETNLRVNLVGFILEEDWLAASKKYKEVNQ